MIESLINFMFILFHFNYDDMINLNPKVLSFCGILDFDIIYKLFIYLGRISEFVIYQNDKNRGMLYTKSKGILYAKGKYILLLDEDDVYVQRNAFTTLYQEAEKYNLDLLSFGRVFSKPRAEYNLFRINRISPNIIFQPELGEIMFKHTQNGEIEKSEGTTHNYFVKRDIFVKSIKQIDKKYLNEKMNFHDDYMMFFLLTRNAYNLKKINKIFHAVINGWNTTDKNVKLRSKEKFRNKKYIRCNSLLNFIEFILYKTKNTFYDKKIAFFSLNKWLLTYWCRNFNKTHKKALNIAKQYLLNKYIQENDKKEIKAFINEKY